MAKEKKKEEETEKEEKKKKEEKPEKKKKSFLLRLLLWPFRFMFKIFLTLMIMALVGLILICTAGFLLYNYFPIKTINLCIGEETEAFNITCISDNDCSTNIFEMMKTSGTAAGSATGKEIGEGINLIRGLLNTIFEKAASCKEGKCQLKKVRGIQEAFQQGGKIECVQSETPFNMTITPKMIFPPNEIKNMAKEFIGTGKIEMPSL